MTDTASPGSTPALTPLPGRSGTPIPIAGSSVRIGQGPQNDVILDDDTVSTSHARLEYVDGSWRLSDLGSRNGTFVDGARIPSGETVDLSSDIPVAFGGVKLIFSPGSGVPAVAAPVETASPTVAKPVTTGPRFRLPLWVLLLIIVVIAIVIALVVGMGGAAAPAAAVSVDEVVLLLGFQTYAPAP